MSSSLPEDVQYQMYHTVPGLEHAKIVRNAYAIEYDCIPATQLKPTLEFKKISGLFSGGQFNGSSGYEEAAAQGLMAGINAAMKVLGREQVILKRSDAYMNMGFLAALAGMVTIARMTSAQPTYGQNYEMDAIGSCFIGGASAYGGTGTVPGVIVGAVLMGVINLGMSLMGVDQNMQKVVKGLVLLAAVIFDVVSKRGGKLIAKN